MKINKYINKNSEYKILFYWFEDQIAFLPMTCLLNTYGQIGNLNNIIKNLNEKETTLKTSESDILLNPKSDTNESGIHFYLLINKYIIF